MEAYYSTAYSSTLVELCAIATMNDIKIGSAAMLPLLAVDFAYWGGFSLATVQHVV